MKAKVGNSIGMTISPRPYESIKVETTFQIEREVEDEAAIEALFESVGKRVLKDLETKMKESYERQKKLKNMLGKV